MSLGGWYHTRLRIISRSEGRSVVSCAAYRIGASFEDYFFGREFDFTSKPDVVTGFTLVPPGTPEWLRDTEVLWNEVQFRENRVNSQLAFEWEIARRVSQWLVNAYGVAVTTGIHLGANSGGGMNDHMHVMMTTRPIGLNGWATHKLRYFNCRPGTANKEVVRVRKAVATIINKTLKQTGSNDRVDHRSFEQRGINVWDWLE